MVECFGGYISSEHEYFGKIIGHATKDVGWQNNIPLIILNDPSILKLKTCTFMSNSNELNLVRIIEFVRSNFFKSSAKIN
jgi:hypothetical protein